MSTWIKIVLGLVIIIAAAIGLAMYATSGMTRAADGFIEKAGSGDMAGARDYLTDSFKARTDAGALGSFLAGNGLEGMQQGKWSSRRYENGRGTLEGSIVTAGGGEVPVSVELLKEHDAWKLHAISVSQPGLRSAPAAPPSHDMPDAAVQLQLLERSMRDFALSAKRRDMDYFRSTTATQFQEEFSSERLNVTFADFMEFSDALLSLLTITPLATADPAIEADGALSLQGYYPAGSKRVVFAERFVPQDGDWKLIQFNLEVMDALDVADTSGEGE